MISDPWIDRAVRRAPRRDPVRDPNRVYKTDSADRIRIRDRQNELRALGKCINAPKVGNVGKHGVVHGPVYRLDRCLHCYVVKAKHDDPDPSAPRTRVTKSSSAHQ